MLHVLKQANLRLMHPSSSADNRSTAIPRRSFAFSTAFESTGYYVTRVRLWRVDGANPAGVVTSEGTDCHNASNSLHYLHNNEHGPYAVVVPAPDVAGGPNMTARTGSPTASVTLDGSGSACFFAPCTYTFNLFCDASITPTAARSGSNSAVFTIGPGSGYDIDMRRAASAKTCRYQMHMWDTHGSTNYYQGYIEVGVCAARRAPSRAGPAGCTHVSRPRGGMPRAAKEVLVGAGVAPAGLSCTASEQAPD